MTGPAANARYYDLHREAILAKRRAKRGCRQGHRAPGGWPCGVCKKVIVPSG